MSDERLKEIRREFVDQMPATWPEGYRAVVIELITEVRRLQKVVTALRKR